MANKQNDWLATLYYNPSMDLSDMKMLDITPDNTEFKTRAEYKNMPAIIDAFKTENGDFNEKKFDALYDMASQLYNNFENNQYLERLPKLLGYLDTQWDAPLDTNFINTSPRIDIHKQENDFSFGLSEVGHIGKGLFADKTPLEIAESQKVVDPITGEELDWTPEDKGGVFKGLTRPTIVLATWDEDGSEIIDGVEVFHKKGDLKYNQNGKPYTELLGDRNPSNKTIVAWTDTFTKESSKWNKYDFFDSDDLEKSFVGVLAKTAFTIAPYFIPYVNYAWAAITASEALGRVLPVIGKAANGIWTGDPNNDFAKKMNIMQGALMRFDPTTTQKSKENLLTFENFGNLVGMIGGQLIQQQAVAALPMLLNGMKATEKTAKWGQHLALDYMALTSGMDSWDTAKEAGMSDRAAGWFFLANVLALRGLMGIDYFRDNVFKHTYMDESTVRVPLFNASKKIAPELVEEAEKVTTAEGANKVISKLQKFYHDNLLNGVKRNDIFNRMLSEGTEEVMEETVLDITKLGAKLTESFGGDLTEGVDPLDFKTDLKDIVQRYGMSFFGGMLGGAMFAGQQKYWNWLGGVDTSSIDNDDFKKLIYYIGEGKADEMRSWLENWHKKGLLGSKNLTSKMSTISSLDGVTPVMEQVSSTNKLSQNDAVYEGMLNFVNTMENIIKSEGLYITPENLARVKKMGFNVNDKTLNADVLANSTEYSHFMDDYLKLAKDIVTANLELKTAITNVTVKEDTPEARKKTEENIRNSVEIAKLQEKLRDLRNQRDEFLNGKYNWKYALEGLFVLNDQINTKFGNPGLEAFARLKGKDISSISPEERTLIENEFEEFQKGEGKYNVSQSAEVYRQLAAYLAPIFENLTQELKEYNLDTKHKLGNYGQNDYVEVLNKYRETESKLNSLRTKEELTEEDKTEIANLTRELADSMSRLRAMAMNPGSMLIAAQNGELIKLGDILQNPNLTPEDWNNIYTGLVNLYNGYASSKMVLSGDSELEAMYNRIRKDFSSMPIMERIMSYMNWKYDSLPDDGDDPNLKDSVVNLSESTSKDGNTWFAYYADENTAFQRHIGELLSQFVNAIGVDNTAANQVYNQILQEFKDNTNVSDADVQEMLNFILPNIGGKNLYDLMLEFDGLRRNIKYTPLTDILNRFFFNYSGRSTSLLDIIAAEERRFADGENVLDYLIYDNQNLEDLKTMKVLLDAVGAVIIGASNKINSSINNFEGNPEPLAVLDDHTSKILIQQFDTLANRINYLLGNAEDNRNRQLRAHEDIDKNMRSKFLKAMISPTFSAVFTKVFSYTDSTGAHEISPNEIWKEVAPTDLVWDTVAMIDEAKLRKAENDFAQKMHDEMVKLPYYNDNETMAKKLVSVFGKNLSFMQTTILGKEGTEVISQYALLNYMLSILGMESTIFNTQYKNTIAQDSFDFAPVYGQELAVKTASAFLTRPELFNAVIDEMMLPENIELPDSMNSIAKKHVETRAKLYNFYIVPGSSGSGKSTGVIGTLSAMLKEHPSHQWITLSKSKTIAKNLADNIVDENVEAYDWESFREDVFGREFGRYKENEENGHYQLEDPITSSKTGLFDKSKALKILAVDEISLFTEAELDALSKWAKSRGILILALGDPLQNAAKVQFERTLNNGTTRIESQNSGLEDTVYMSSPMLTASLRAINLAQKTNFENIYNRLYATYVESTKHGAWDVSNYDGSLNTDDLNIEFYENPSVIFGTKIVDDTDLIAEARKKKGTNSVAIVYDETTESKYKTLDEEGITLVPYNDMQGREFEYVFVDVDWKKHSRLSATYVSKYNAMRDFYTVTQRAKVGGIVIDNGIKELLNIHQTSSNPKMNQIFEIDENQKSRFKEARLEAMSGLPEKDGFNETITGIIVAPKPTAKPSPVPEPTPASAPAVKAPVKAPTAPAEVPVSPAPSSGMSTPPVEPLPEVAPKPIPAQPIVEPTPTAVIGDNEVFYKWLYNVDGFTSFEKANGNSLFNVVKRISPKYVFQAGTYRDVVNSIASCIRNDGNISAIINSILRPLTLAGQNATVNGLKEYFKNTPELRVNPLTDGQSIVSARFYNGEDYITIPLMLINGIKSGVYKGKISRIRKAEKGTRGNHISGAQFRANNPGVWISDAAILAMSDEKRNQITSSSDYAESTKELLLDRGNLGKIGIVFTDEPFIAENRFNGYLFTDDNGFILKDYDDVALMFTQKIGSLTDIVKYAKAMAYIKNPEHLQARNRGNYTREPMYEPAEDIALRVMGLDARAIPNSGTERYQMISNHFQILDTKNIGSFFKAVLTLANTNIKYKGIYDALFGFLNTFKSKNTRNKDYDIQEQNAIWARVGDTSYLFEAVQNEGRTELNVFTYDFNENTLALVDHLDSIPHVRNLFENYFGNNVPEVQLVYHLYSYEKTGKFKEDKVQANVEANDQIYYMFKGVSLDDSDNEVFNNLEIDGRVPYKNGIYLNVKGIPAYGDDSVWMAAAANVQTLMTDIQNIVYSQYSIDENEIVPYDETPKVSEFDTFVTNLVEFLKTNGISDITEESLKNMGSSDDIFIQLNHQFEVEAFEKKNSPIKTVLSVNDNNKLNLARIADYEGFITWFDDKVKSVTPIEVSTLDSHNFIIYQTENGEYKILRKENGKWEAVSFKSYESFNNLISLFSESNEFTEKILPIKDYVYSLVSPYSAALDAIAERATEYMYNNIADPNIAAIYEQINNYLLERLENNEC